ncbi:hypothetical protein SETIT_3G396600v2 [Setaria italica]|uniref:F-box domain-containing protein n=1 Tax=Setaria italica TaxID=4555 RepID=K3Z6N1_SETIT|nr:F-box/kelch-repeat protein At3g23880 [Setaria italica]XP_012700110.1 F-box/kelch-repeat protein At3g23880 [Setaria italica]RCV19573.1 hypothetical protein SETIT_3G396600v2 [Setaria italica]
MDHPKRSAAAAPSLPDDALVEILSRVPAKSLCRFKCVSRAWRDLIADRLRCNRLPQTLEGFFYVFDGDDETQGGSSDAGGVSPDRAVHGRFINTLGKPSPLASFSFLGKVPGIEEFGLLRSCNGLLLFGHRRAGDSYDSLGYIVCNPATEQWVAVPSSGWGPDYNDESEDSDSDTETSCTFTYLVFDPAASSHFQLVQFWVDDTSRVEAVHTYSSETGVWCERLSTWGDDFVAFFAGSAFVGGMLHFSNTSYFGWEIDQELIVAVDGEGGICRVISGPQKLCDVAFVGQSQGRLHYMNQHGDSTGDMTGLSIWVLQDYDTEEWVLKHSVTFMQLFRRMSCRVQYDYSVIAIHPDRNLIFFFQHWNLELKSYDMDSEEVCTLHTLGVCPHNILPYVPYFAESSALAGKH